MLKTGIIESWDMPLRIACFRNGEIRNNKRTAQPLRETKTKEKKPPELTRGGNSDKTTHDSIIGILVFTVLEYYSTSRPRKHPSAGSGICPARSINHDATASLQTYFLIDTINAIGYNDIMCFKSRYAKLSCVILPRLSR